MDLGIVFYKEQKRSGVYAERKTPRMSDVAVGHTTMISYNPEKPEMAYITENIGIMNV